MGFSLENNQYDKGNNLFIFKSRLKLTTRKLIYIIVMDWFYLFYELLIKIFLTVFFWFEKVDTELKKG